MNKSELTFREGWKNGKLMDVLVVNRGLKNTQSQIWDVCVTFKIVSVVQMRMGVLNVKVRLAK